MSHTLDGDFSQNQEGERKSIKISCYIKVILPAFSFLFSLLIYSLSLENTPFEWLHLIIIIILFLNFKWKPKSLLFLCVLTSFFPLLWTFISIVVYCKSSGHFGMRFGRKTQYRIKLLNTHLRVGKRLETARKKPKGVWASGGYKGHFVFFHVPLLSLPFCLLFPFVRGPLPCLYFCLPLLFHRTV